MDPAFVFPPSERPGHSHTIQPGGGDHDTPPQQKKKPLYPVQQGVLPAAAVGMGTQEMQVNYTLQNIMQCGEEMPLKAVLAGNPEFVTRLIPQDNVSSVGLVHLAAVRGRPPLLEVLLSYGADVNMRASRGETPLHFACRRGLPNIVKWLLEKGAHLDAVDNEGNTAAHFAAQSGVCSVVELLHQRGLDLNARNAAGSTLVHTCVASSQPQLMHFLLKHRRADPSITDFNGTSALDLALRNGESNQAALLIEYCPKLINSASAPALELIENPRMRLKVSAAVEVLLYYRKPAYVRRIEYWVSASNMLLLVALAMTLHWTIGYYGEVAGGAIVAVAAYFVYYSSHRLQQGRTPSPTLAGSFFAGLLFTSACSVQYSMMREDVTHSVYLRMYVLLLIPAIFTMYTKLLLRGTPRHLPDTTVSMWDLASDASRYNAWCPQCYRLGTARTKHCKLCEECVDDMDHHCTYLLCCIGRHNHRLFILFSIAVLVAQASFVALALSIAHDALVSSNFDHASLLGRHYLLCLCLPPNCWSVVWGANFCLTQLSLVSRGETSYFRSRDGRAMFITRPQRALNVLYFLAGRPLPYT